MDREAVTVVGAGGHVGSHVVASLLAGGYDVHGTLRDADGGKAGWLMAEVAPLARGANRLRLYSADVFDRASLTRAMAGTTGVICCAGSPEVVPETVDLMVAVAGNVSDAAIGAGIPRAVFTSSTGSTNPPDGEPGIKNEVEHWSDPELQLSQGKFAAVGKSRHDRIVLGRMEASGGRFRAAIINPSMVVGPAFGPEPPVSLRRFAAIINGERMADRVPNSSMSLTDVRDLAELHVAALGKEEARGRYFGVKRSWHWRDILRALGRAWPAYRMPEPDAREVPVRPTQFDLTRQSSLGVALRGLDEMMEGLVAELVRRAMI